MSVHRIVLIASALIALSVNVTAREEIYLGSSPALSPDGKTLVFTWRGDIWSAPSQGGAAKRLTRHPASDSYPRVSPDGLTLAFVSDRDNGRQVYTMPIDGGAPERLTYHTEGYALVDWYPDGNSLLTRASRDHYWRDSSRLFRISSSERSAETMLFDAACGASSLASDGKRVLFAKQDRSWSRKGYRGSAAAQIWLFDPDAEDGKAYQELLKRETGSRSPLWKPNGKGFYYAGEQSGAYNIWEYDLKSGEERQLTFFEEDSVVAPCLSRNGSTMVFRHLFDFYRYRPGGRRKPERIDLWTEEDVERPKTQHRVVNRAAQAAFSKDGLDVAFISGGDVWVMDTVLREPKQVTSTPGEENSLGFAPDGKSLLFVCDIDGQEDIWRATRKDSRRYWWQNDEFALKRLTDDADEEGRISFSPDGKRIAYVKGGGDLYFANVDLTSPALALESWSAPSYDWSPDGRWIVYSHSDDDFNRDIWLMRTDGSGEPFNLSRHPDNDSGPVWSPDGKVIAFTGNRTDRESDIYFVWLTDEDNETTSRDRTLKKAIEKITKVRKKPATKSKKEDKPTSSSVKTDDDSTTTTAEDGASTATAKNDRKTTPTAAKKPPKKKETPIDFDGIHQRIKRVSIANTREGDLFWSHDSKKLAFTATIDGKRGTYTIEFPDKLKPTLLSTTTGSGARWITRENQILWLANGVPASMTSSGKATSYPFQARQSVDIAERYRAGFLLAWRNMRDSWYDENHNNRDWNAIREKYEDHAARSGDADTFGRVIALMLGELNGSHLGFSPTRTTWRSPDAWEERTVHFGLRFDASHEGLGLKVRDVVQDTPAAHARSKVKVGETVLQVNGTTVTSSMDLTAVLNMKPDEEARLLIADDKGATRSVSMFPTTFGDVRGRLRTKWERDNQAFVDKATSGALGYLAVRAMAWPSFEKFEQDIYAQGAGRDGLIIDVRNNGGGFTTDYLLTVLCQPSHALTVPRGGGPGYPQDRHVYSKWDKPIVVLCNQNSFSNAEIFSHAITTLGRGRLVGVATAGGVISTGSKRIMELGTLRMPFRGWFKIDDGEDMELNGAVPDFIVWPQPGELPNGKDTQLEKAIEVLMEDVAKAKANPRPTVKYAAEKRVGADSK